MTLITDPAKAAPDNSNPNPPANPNPGNPPADWRSNLPEDLRGEKVFESIKGKDWTEAGPALAKGYVNAQRLVGAEKLVVPPEGAPPEQVAEFYRKLGRPESFDKYSYKVPEGLKPEQLNQKEMDEWRKELFEAGLTGKQADRIMSKYLEKEWAGHQARTKMQAETKDKWLLEMKASFGAKFDEKVNYAHWAFKEFGDKEGKLAKFLDDSGLGSHPLIVSIFSQIGERMADDKARNGGGPGPRFNSAPQNAGEAQAALAAFNRDPENTKALFDRAHPSHDSVVEARRKLYEAAYPKESANS